jgi:toxin ParE1/3/4
VRGYILSPEAQQDLLLEIRAYYSTYSDARVARYVMGEITRAFRFLATTPGAGHTRADLTPEPVKFWSVFSYLIAYDPARQPPRVGEGCEAWTPIAAAHVSLYLQIFRIFAKL